MGERSFKPLETLRAKLSMDQKSNAINEIIAAQSIQKAKIEGDEFSQAEAEKDVGTMLANTIKEAGSKLEKGTERTNDILEVLANLVSSGLMSQADSAALRDEIQKWEVGSKVDKKVLKPLYDGMNNVVDALRNAVVNDEQGAFRDTIVAKVEEVLMVLRQMAAAMPPGGQQSPRGSEEDRQAAELGNRLRRLRDPSQIVALEDLPESDAGMSEPLSPTSDQRRQGRQNVADMAQRIGDYAGQPAADAFRNVAASPAPSEGPSVPSSRSSIGSLAAQAASRASSRSVGSNTKIDLQQLLRRILGSDAPDNQQTHDLARDFAHFNAQALAASHDQADVDDLIDIFLRAKNVTRTPENYQILNKVADIYTRNRGAGLNMKGGGARPVHISHGLEQAKPEVGFVDEALRPMVNPAVQNVVEAPRVEDTQFVTYKVGSFNLGAIQHPEYFKSLQRYLAEVPPPDTGAFINDELAKFESARVDWTENDSRNYVRAMHKHISRIISERTALAKGEQKGSGVVADKKPRPSDSLKVDRYGKFGSLKFDMRKFNMMILSVKKGKKKVAEGRLSPDLYDLLTKKFNKSRTYAPDALDEFKKLVELAGLSSNNGTSAKNAVLQGRAKAKMEAAVKPDLIPNIKKVKRKPKRDKRADDYIEGIEKKRGRVNQLGMPSTNKMRSPDELVERLHVLIGSIHAGNDNNSLLDEASTIADNLRSQGVISKDQFEGVMGQLFGPM